MSIKKSFKEYMESLALVGPIYIGAVPKNAPTKAWWITSGGGSPSLKNDSGEKMKQYIISVFYRNTDSEDVDEVLEAFEKRINSKNCDQLPGYDTIELEASGFQSDQDLDAEDRTVGLVEVTATVYERE